MTMRRIFLSLFMSIFFHDASASSDGKPLEIDFLESLEGLRVFANNFLVEKEVPQKIDTLSALMSFFGAILDPALSEEGNEIFVRWMVGRPIINQEGTLSAAKIKSLTDPILRTANSQYIAKRATMFGHIADDIQSAPLDRNIAAIVDADADLIIFLQKKEGRLVMRSLPSNCVHNGNLYLFLSTYSTLPYAQQYVLRGGKRDGFTGNGFKGNLSVYRTTPDVAYVSTGTFRDIGLWCQTTVPTGLSDVLLKEGETYAKCIAYIVGSLQSPFSQQREPAEFLLQTLS